MRTFKKIIWLLFSIMLIVIGLILSPFAPDEFNIPSGLMMPGGAMFVFGVVLLGWLSVVPIMNWFCE